MNNYPLQHRISQLIIKHLRGALTTAERIEMEVWINENPGHKKLFDELSQEEMLRADVKGIPELKNRIRDAIYAQLPEARTSSIHRAPSLKGQGKVIPLYRKSLMRVAAAAVIVLLLSVGGYFYFAHDNSTPPISASEIPLLKNDVAAPETNKAVLTLEDGTIIQLDTASNGALAVQGNVNVIKTTNGQIVYQGDASEIKYNTLINPKGSKPVQLKLADGSEVWLNVASSITFPTAFVNKERKVQITGEAYFEIAHNAAMPFIVEKNEVSIQVLGTHFNVNSYDDEAALRITLLEGSVRVSTNNGQRSTVIKPRQQARVVGSQLSVASGVDIDETMAWKNGLFSFNKADLKTVLRQLTKWYDVEVVYQGNVPNQTFGGDMERSLSLGQILRVLEKSDVHFEINGKKIIVMP